RSGGGSLPARRYACGARTRAGAVARTRAGGGVAAYPGFFCRAHPTARACRHCARAADSRSRHGAVSEQPAGIFASGASRPRRIETDIRIADPRLGVAQIVSGAADRPRRSGRARRGDARGGALRGAAWRRPYPHARSRRIARRADRVGCLGLARRGYFGLIPRLLPDEPGGGITGMLFDPTRGGVCVISGSMPPGGWMTPPERSSLSL